MLLDLYVLKPGVEQRAYRTQTDDRVAAIEVKVRKLDGELARYKEQMGKLRDGPGKVRYPPPRLSHTDESIQARNPTTGPAHSATTQIIRSSTRTANSTNIQHGVCPARHGQPSQYNGHA